MIGAEAEKAAEAQHGVEDFPAGLIDHDPFDFADLLVLGAVYDFARLFIAVDQVLALASVGISSSFAGEEGTRPARRLFLASMISAAMSGG